MKREILGVHVSNAKISVTTIASGEGSLNERLVSICRIIYDLCPEVQQVEAIAVASDGKKSALPDAEKSPARKYLRNPIRDIRRNIAFDESISRLHSANSWSERLRGQERLATNIARVLDEAIPRLINTHDNASRHRAWLEQVGHISSEARMLPSIPLSPTDAVERRDPAKDLVDSLALALRQLANAVASDKPLNFVGIASQLRSVFRPNRYPQPDGASLPEREDWPILRRLREQLDRLRDGTELLAGLLFVLAHDHSLFHASRRESGSWAETAGRLISAAARAILEDEKLALHAILSGAPHELRLISASQRDEIRLVTDRWLIIADSDKFLDVGRRLMDLPEEVALAVGFRTFILAVNNGKVLPMFAQMLGRHKGKPFLYPVARTQVEELARRAELPLFSSRLVDDAVHILGLITSASQLVAHYRLRDERLGRDVEKQAARARLSEARTALDDVGHLMLKQNLAAAIQEVEAELSGERGSSLAGRLERSVFSNESNEAMALAARIVLIAVEAALPQVP